MGKRVSAVVAVAASLLLLAGCATSADPQGLSTAQLDAYAARNQDLFWAQSGLPDSMRPHVVPRRFVRYEEVGNYYATCMNDHDTTGVTYTAFDLRQHNVQVRGASADVLIADYECQSYYQAIPETAGYLSSDQLSATYDYYREWLVPCLEVHGFDVLYVPQRSALVIGPGVLTWNPYKDIHLSDAAYYRLERMCPPDPSFLND